MNCWTACLPPILSIEQRCHRQILATSLQLGWNSDAPSRAWLSDNGNRVQQGCKSNLPRYSWDWSSCQFPSHFLVALRRSRCNVVDRSSNFDFWSWRLPVKVCAFSSLSIFLLCWMKLAGVSGLCLSRGGCGGVGEGFMTFVINQIWIPTNNVCG